MNLDMIRITENEDEMISIAKEIVSIMPQKYTPKVMSMLRDTLESRLPSSSEKDIDDYLYITIYHYWVYGCTVDEYFYYEFYNKTHNEKSKYMTLRVRWVYMNYLNKEEDSHLLFNKYETYQLLKEYYRRDVIMCRSIDDYPVFLDFITKHKEFVVKPSDLSGGRGVYKTDVIGLNEEEIRTFYLKLINEAKNTKEKYLKNTDCSVVIEELIEQDDSLAVFNPESVNGVRLPTVTIDGKTHFYQPWLKIGRGGNFLTSAVFGTMDAGIDAQTGIIDTPGMNESGEVWSVHPDSGINIVGFKIPHWQQLLDLAQECASLLPQFRYIGWDFVLSKKGWCIMEANYSGDFMWQLYRNKGMKKEFEDLIGWKMNKEFWWQE